MTKLQITGKEQLERVAASLTEHADGRSLRNKMRRDFRNAGADITKEQRANLADRLPHRGGLSSVASSEGKFGVRTRLAGKSVAVDIVDGWKGHDMPGIDSGKIRHPLFGNRHHWYTTKTTRRLLSRPVARQRRRLQLALIKSLDELAEEIAKET